MSKYFFFGLLIVTCFNAEAKTAKRSVANVHEEDICGVSKSSLEDAIEEMSDNYKDRAEALVYYEDKISRTPASNIRVSIMRLPEKKVLYTACVTLIHRDEPRTQ